MPNVKCSLCPGPGGRFLWFALGLPCTASRQVNDKGGPLSPLALDLHGAAHAFNNPIADVQAQSGPFSRRFGSEKGSKNFLEVIRANPGAVVPHGNFDPTVRARACLDT